MIASRARAILPGRVPPDPHPVTECDPLATARDPDRRTLVSIRAGSPGPHPGRPVEPGAARGARGEHRPPARPRPRQDRPPALASRAGQRARPPPVLPGHRGGDPRRGRDDARRGVVRRQLPHRGHGGAAGPRGPAARVLPSAAEARGRPARGIPARARPRVGLRRAHRQSRRARDPPALRPRLPAGAAADHRRALGRPDRPPDRARREPPPARRAHRERARGPPGRRRPGQRSARPGRPTRAPPRVPGAPRRGPVRRVHGRARAAPAGAGPAVDSGAAMAGRADRQAGRLAGRARPGRAPEPGRDERDGPQRDHEPAHDVDPRLGGLLRERQPRRRYLRADTRFGDMDFATRDQYRHAIEDLARDSRRPELEVTRLAMAAARRAAPGRARRGSRLPPPRGGSTALREGDRLPRPGEAMARAGLPDQRDPALPRDHRGRDRRAPRAAAPRRARLRHEPSRAGPPGAPRGDPGLGSGDRPRQPGGDGPDRAPGAAASRAARRRASEPADARGRADAAHERGRDRGARQSPRDPLPRQPGRRSPLRPPVGLDRRAGRDDAGGRSAPRGGGRRHRAPQCPQRSRADRGGALSPAASPAALEPPRGQVDGMGAQAREARRAEPPARGRERHELHRGPGAPARGTRGRPLRDHPRCRHPAAARCRGPSRRHHGPSLEPARPRRSIRPAWSTATPSSSPGSRPRSPPSTAGRSSSGSLPVPPESTRTPPRPPTSTRISSARARTPARASTTWPPSPPRSMGACPRTPC